jgi:hypothetical protein
MRLLGIAALALLLIAPSAMAVQNASEGVGAPVGYDSQPTAPMWGGPAAVLYDNGPLVTHPGGGAGGADASALQTGLGMGTYGMGHQFSLCYLVADDFTVPAGDAWNIDGITFFAYQTGSGTFSSITGVYLEISDGPPPGGTVVYGDYVTNRMASTAWSNIYRTLDTDIATATSRPIMANVTSTPGLSLGPGTYWISWMTNGSGTSGPWAPPVTVLGSTGTGNGMQSLDCGASFATVTDGGTFTPQDFPFIIEGNRGGTATEGSTWSQLKALYR